MKKILDNNFKFSKQNFVKAKSIVAKYPKKFQISAILPLLHLVQEQLGGWISKSSIELWVPGDCGLRGGLLTLVPV